MTTTLSPSRIDEQIEDCDRLIAVHRALWLEAKAKDRPIEVTQRLKDLDKVLDDRLTLMAFRDK